MIADNWKGGFRQYFPLPEAALPRPRSIFEEEPHLEGTSVIISDYQFNSAAGQRRGNRQAFFSLNEEKEVTAESLNDPLLIAMLF
jgi:hypothetical protein